MGPPHADVAEAARTPRDEQFREPVMEAAAALLAEVGYLDMTIDALAARAGVAKKTIYRWRAHKAAIAADVVVARGAVHPVPDLGDTRAELRVVFDLGIAYATEGINEITAVLAAAVGDDPEVPRRIREGLIAPRRDLALDGHVPRLAA
ncbi:hypothetical protein GCM10022221_26930 [Actinocorallia aurea]